MPEWIQNLDPDAEYNEHTLFLGENTFVLYSNVDETEWSITYPDESYGNVVADDLESAKKVAMKYAMEYTPF